MQIISIACITLRNSPKPPIGHVRISGTLVAASTLLLSACLCQDQGPRWFSYISDNFHACTQLKEPCIHTLSLSPNQSRMRIFFFLSFTLMTYVFGSNCVTGFMLNLLSDFPAYETHNAFLVNKEIWYFLQLAKDEEEWRNQILLSNT